MSGEKKARGSSEVTKTKNGSFRSIFMHADGVDMFLMVLGYIGAIGDGFSTPLVLFLTSKFMNNIGGVSNVPIDVFTHNINKVHLYFSFSPFLKKKKIIFYRLCNKRLIARFSYFCVTECSASVVLGFGIMGCLFSR